jgi:methionyl-tRNA synthetase
MPDTAQKILSQINAQEIPYENLDQFGAYVNGTKVTDSPEILFARLDINEVMERVNELHPAAPQEPEAPAEPVIDLEAKPEITFEEFGKMQFQVGEIIECKPVEKSKKLLCSQVRIGSQTKQIVSGIQKHYTPEQMVGKKVMVLVNLKPAKLAGVLSEGMLLCAEDENGELALMVPDRAMPAGAEIC